MEFSLLQIYNDSGELYCWRQKGQSIVLDEKQLLSNFIGMVQVMAAV